MMFIVTVTVPEELDGSVALTVNLYCDLSSASKLVPVP